MIIRSMTLAHFCHAATAFNWLVFAITLSLAVSVFCFRGGSHESETEALPHKLSAMAKEEDPPLVKNEMNQGAFQLDRKLTGVTFFDLDDQFRVLGKATRPDVSPQDMRLQIGIKGGRETTMVLGEKLYLSFTSTGDLDFTETPSPLWIEPSFSSKKQVVAELGLQLVDPSTQAMRESKRPFVLREAPVQPGQKEEDTAFARAWAILEKGKWWGIDRLFEAYGGEKYTKLKECQRIECVAGDVPFILYVQQGDCAIWNGRQWVLAQLGEETRGRPLARVQSLSSHEILWEVWDVTGLRKKQIRHTPEKGKALRYCPEKVFSRIRQRTTTSVSCRIEKKSILLKRGDWLLKTQLGWRVLKSFQDVQDVLNFKLVGDLFVFDKLEKSHGNQVFSGTFFNATRTQKQEVRIPITHKKKVQYSPHAKNPISSKIRSVLQEDPQEEHLSEKQIRRKNIRKKRHSDRRDTEEDA